MALVHAAAALITSIQKVFSRKWTFLALFVCTFMVSYTTLAAFDLLPEVPVSPVAEVPSVALTASALQAEATPELPLHIEIPKLGISTDIGNPTSTSIELLDKELLTRAVRYPTSAKLGETGNVVLFGHSSYLPVVNNKAFKLFNEIQNLKKGDTIMVKGDSRMYVYAVKTVSQEDAESAAIPLTVGEPTLTLATCDSFGKKSDRFVVVATLVESYPLES
jgi:LPXTG-site transpeptidase (sortase) family protein